MDFSNLKNLPLDQLKVLARQYGVSTRGKIKQETIAKKILEAATAPQKSEMKHAAEQPKTALKINTEQEVREACIKYFNANGFEAIFKDDTWHFKCRGAEDCGHMSVPLRIIRMKAEMVARGARHPIMLGKNVNGEDVMAA